MRTVAVVLDGVLRKPLDKEARDTSGIELFLALTEHFRVVVLGGENQDADVHWLMVNGLTRYVHYEPIRPWDMGGITTQRLDQIGRLRAAGWQFDFVMVPDPVVAKDLYAMGVIALLYIHPVFTSHTFRPDFEGGIKSWEDMSAEVEWQLTAKATANEVQA